MSASYFAIDLERSSGVFYAGEIVRGTVRLTTTAEIKTRGVRVRYQGHGWMHYHTGSGDDRSDMDGYKVYEEHRYTMFGNYFNTSILYEAGADAEFGSAGGDGTMYVPCNTNERLELIVRVMDYDFGKKDDLLGEIVLDVTSLVESGEMKSFPLQRKGRPEKGQVSLSAKIIPMNALFPASASSTYGSANAYSAICELRAHRATGLRKADFIGKNDVYVQAYRLPDRTVDRSKALPEPDRRTTLPAGTLIFPFAFPIRADAPGSAELPVADWAFIRYNLYANIDIAWWKDPSVKRTITVIASRPLPPPTLLYPIEYKCLDPMLVSTCCCLPWCTRVGSVTLDMRLGRQVFASGERLDFSALLHNSTSKALVVKVEVVCRVLMQTTGKLHCEHFKKVKHDMLTETVAPQQEWRIDGADREVRLPPLYPSFFGARGMATAHWDPVTFTYELVVSAGVEGACVFRKSSGLPFIVSAVPPSATAVQRAREEDSPAAAQLTTRPENPFQLGEHVTDASQQLELASQAGVGSLPQATLVSAGGSVNTYIGTEDASAVAVQGRQMPYQPQVLTYAAYDPAVVPSRTTTATAITTDYTDSLPLGTAEVMEVVETPPLVDDPAVQRCREELIATLARSSSNQLRSAVRTWAQKHPAVATSLSLEDLRIILQSVSFSMDQISVSLELAQCMGRANLTCAHIVAAVECCVFYKAEVATAMAPYVRDAANKRLVLDLLPSFDRAAVEGLFR